MASFPYVTPESVGISSTDLLTYLQSVEDAHLVTHDILMMRGNSLFFEHYVPPFHQDFLHREYSVTKSFVSLAVGFALDDGLLSLDDPIEKYFAKELEGQTDVNLRRQTIRQMLMMATAKPNEYWFGARTDDRVRYYFQNRRPETRPGGSFFEYDSTGSFVMGALVERLTNMTLRDYLWEKMFSKIGVSAETRFLKCPGGHSWGDSALLMKARDFLTCARFVLNGGSWNGEQLISQDYIRAATSKQIGNDTGRGRVCDNGYGYYFWKLPGEGFFFYGMGCQFAVCVPEKDMILIYNGDNQGNDEAGMETVIGGFLRIVAKNADCPLPENPQALEKVKEYSSSRKLMAAWGDTASPAADTVSGKRYLLSDNPMGMKEFTFTLKGSRGTFAYVNGQGAKSFDFGLGENVFGQFPQEGYSDEIGSVPGKHLYGCAASAAWEEPLMLRLKVQLIDDYFGNFDFRVRFSKDFSRVSVLSVKTAEDFLNEYNGNAEGTLAQ